MADNKAGGAILDQLYAVIESRKGADPESSYTASLFAHGTDKIAGKLSEETAETIVEAARGDRARLVNESADLLYHLLVLWAHQGIDPKDVWAELSSRQGISGIEEKKSRKTD